jgi:hypothetical protein
MKGAQWHIQVCSLHICCHILHADVEATDEAHASERDLPDQEPAHSVDGRLVG